MMTYELLARFSLQRSTICPGVISFLQTSAQSLKTKEGTHCQAPWLLTRFSQQIIQDPNRKLPVMQEESWDQPHPSKQTDADTLLRGSHRLLPAIKIHMPV